ncbi:MAG: signal transduction histidine kinase/DNA-binding NarL/FixJ family response regulator [Saprospiraceae bacterium]
MRNILLLTYLFLIHFACIGQDYLLEYQNLTTKDGLANKETYSSFKDSNGFLWISTKYGLNRYDGYEYKLFTKEKNGLYSNERISQIKEDNKGNIWLFYYGYESQRRVEAIDVFNPNSGKLTPVQAYISGDLPFELKDIFISKSRKKEKDFWIYGKKGQLFLYKNKAFKKIIETPGKVIRGVAEIPNGLLVASGKELLQLNLKGEILRRDTLPDKIYQIWEDNNTVWVRTKRTSELPQTNIIWKKENFEGTFEAFPIEFDKYLAVGLRGFFHRDQSGYWYISASKSKFHDPFFKVFDSLGKEIFDLKDIKLPANSIFETDKKIWLSSPNGLMKLKISENPFQLIHQEIKSSNARGITEDEAGNIYFLINKIFQYNPVTEKVKTLTSQKGTYPLIYRDSLLHSGTYLQSIAGINFNLKTGQESISYPWEKYSPTLSAIETDEPSLFILGGQKGLSYFDIYKNEGSAFDAYNEFEELKNIAVYGFYKNKTGIWIATEEGIYLLKENRGIVHRFSSENGDLPFDNIKHITENSEGNFWLATSGGGIINWQPSLDENQPSTFRQFTTANGLSNDYTYAVYPDEFGFLWVSSDVGLMRIDTANFHIKTFFKEDGLPHNEFNTAAHYKAKDGTFYFGGFAGLISFHPGDFLDKKRFDVPMQLTNFQLWEGGKSKMTNKTDDFQVTRSINIHPGDKLLELHFALLDFDKPENHRYAYKIEGFDERERVIEENYLRITNLPYGNYTLKIKGQNLTKGWSEQELSILIHILKPFYLKWWFIGAMILSGLGLVFAYFLRRERRHRKESQRLETEVKNRTQTIQKQTEELRELDKAKTRFFSNITHELRTPLTLILGPSMQMAQNDVVPIAQRKESWNISKNAQHLLSLINQMLDLSKIEGGQMKVEISKGDIVSFIKELTERFTHMADKKRQELHFITSETVWETHFDRNKLNKILFNLLSNALKFTEEEGIVNVFLEKVEEDTILIKVEDNGIGIKPEQLDRVFDRFYQADGTTTRANEGTGIGLSLVKELVDLLEGNIDISSKLGEGTQFKISLPVLEITKGQISGKKEQELLAPTLILPALSTAEPNLAHSLENPIWQHSKLDLLIIEDNEGIHDYIRSCIDTEKYNIITAYNGEEGIQKAFELIPDLIISDIMMPIKDGFDVITAVRNHLPTSHIPLILLTAKSSLENRLQGLKRGADAYLTKPFSPRELSLRIDKLIEIRQILHSRYRNGAEFPNEDLYHKEDAFVKKIRTYIIENIERTDLNGDIIGKHFGYSRMHIYRKLKALTNQSISEMIKEIRLQKAMELLQDKSNDLNITEVTYKTGFSSISYFSKTFKNFYGKAPSEA